MKCDKVGLRLAMAPKQENLHFFLQIEEYKDGKNEQQTNKNRRYLDWCRNHECYFRVSAERIGAGLENYSD
ncbi:hypothetical protein L3i20_v233020 [Paenibacillus sp. L3-i20]|nr:hypothetical protein L3i20_v233020 [Paenibacillus sp. L3-i20]